MVGGGEFTRVPCVLFLRFLGRLAAGSASDLILAVPSALFRNRRDGLWVSPIRDEAQRLETWRNVMTDPRFTDPRLSDPVVRRDESAAGGMWGWIAGVAVLLLIGFLIIAGWNNNTNTASSGSSTTTSSSTAPKMTPPASTTGSGSSSTQPLAPPAPSAPLPRLRRRRRSRSRLVAISKKVPAPERRRDLIWSAGQAFSRGLKKSRSPGLR